MRKIVSLMFVAFALAVVVSPVEAGNRSRRGNIDIEIKKVCKTEVNQTNVSNISNNVGVVLNTGGNKANGNTGDATITTGDATSTVTITNTTGGNVAVVSGCCCGGCGNVCGDLEGSCQL